MTNPIAADQSLMRISCSPASAKNIQENAKYFDAFRLFEIGREIHKRDNDLPDEITHFAAAIYIEGGHLGLALFELKRLAECLAPACGVHARPVHAPTNIRPAPRTSYWRQNNRPDLRTASHNDRNRAAVGARYRSGRARHTAHPTDRRYQPVNRFPSSAFDLSVVADLRELVG